MNYSIIDKIKSGFGIFYISQVYALKSQLVYRSQAALTFIDTFVGTIVPIAFISIVYNVSRGIQGWSFYQLLLMLGLVNFAYIVIYFANPSRVNYALKTGFFDTYLTKPHNPILMLLSRTEGMWSLVYGVWAILLIAYAASHLSFSLINLVPFAILALGGVATFMFFTLFTGIAAYRIFTQANFQVWLINNINTFGQYPLRIYGNVGAVLFTFIAPIALASFYPAAILLGKINMLYFFAILAIEIALSSIFLKLSAYLLKGYTSAQG